MDDQSNTELRELPLADLQPHPLRTSLLGEPTNGEILRFQRYASLVGTLPVPQVTSDLLVITGTAELEVMIRRGAREMSVPRSDVTGEVIVRHDLVDNEAVELELLADVLLPRRLTPMEVARCTSRFSKLAAGVYDDADVLARDQIMQRLHVGKRQAVKYLRLAEMPRSLQDAVDAGELDFKTAYAIAMHDDETQDAIDRAVHDGASLREALDVHLVRGDAL